MAFRQYTECEDPGDYVDLSFTLIGYLNIFGRIVAGTILSFILAALVGGPLKLIIAIALFTLAVSYLHWWLNGRLICLGGEQCLIGMVRGLSAADPLEKGGDDDFSMNVMLAPAPSAFRTDFGSASVPGPPPPVSDYQGAVQGGLVSEQSSILAIGRSYVGDEDHLKYMTGLHCEFEGSGIYNLMLWAGIVLALLIAALALELLGPVGWLIKLLIMLAIFFGGTGILTGPLAGPNAAGAGHPTDVDPELATLEKGHIVVVKGIWVYDSLHHGWNEIHPIRDCVIIAEEKMAIGGAWPTDIGDGLGLDTEAKVKITLGRWCRMLDDARDSEEDGSRDDPKNDWILHPLVDSCQDTIIL